MKKKIISIILLILLLCPFMNVDAASLGISASSTTVTTGGSVNITVKANGLAGRFSITSSNSNVLSGGENSKWLENESYTYKFTAKSVGTATVTIKAINAADSSSSASFNGSKSITIKVVKPREKSTNNNLKSLSVSGYEITPSFNKNTLEYTVNLESSVETITINATKEDGYANVSGAGDKSLVEGDNNFEIVVTSETGNKKVYKLNAIVKDNNPIEKIVDNKKYTVIKRESSLTPPNDQYTKTQVNINNISIPGFINEKSQITLIGLKDENGIIYLFKYNKDNDSLKKYEQLTSKNITVIFEETDEKIEKYEKKEINIDDKSYTVYQNDDKDYALIYGTNLETNEKGWFSYNLKDKTIQTYSLDNYNKLINDFKSKIDEYKIVIIVLSCLSLLLLLIILIEIHSKSKLKKKFNNRKENIKIEDSILEEKEIVEEPPKEKIEEINEIITDQQELLENNKKKR